MSHVCFVFSSKTDADNACLKCNDGLGILWAKVVRRTSDDKYFYEKPDEFDYNCEACAEETKCEYDEETNDGSWENGTA